MGLPGKSRTVKIEPVEVPATEPQRAEPQPERETVPPAREPEREKVGV